MIAEPLFLTPEDRNALREMLVTPGWQVAKRIAEYAEKQALELCATAEKDQRYCQGILRGIRGAWLDLISHLEPPQEPKKNDDSYV